MTPLLILCVLGSTARSEPPIELPKVLVAGQRAVQDAAAPSSVVDRKQMQDAVADLPEVLDQQPGLRVSRIGGLGTFSPLSVRGSTSDQVLVFVDGIPLNSAEGGPVDLSTIPLGPIDRIVVYRGVSPALFGGSAIGGVVSVETRPLGAHVLEVEAGGGSFDTRAARAFYGGGGSAWGGAISVDYLGSAGDFAFQHDGGTAFDTSDDADVARRNNAFDQLAVMAKSAAAFGDVRISLLNLLTWRDRGVPGQALQQTDHTSLSALRNLLGMRIETSTISGRRAHLSLVPYVSFSQTQLRDPQAEILLEPRTTRDRSTVPGVTSAFRIPIALDDDARFVLTPTLAAEYRYERFAPDLVDAPSTAASQRHFATAAAELELIVDPIDSEIILSGRVEHVRSDLEDVQRESFQAAPQDSAPTEWTWRVGLVQRPAPDLALKANVSQSARFPTLYELFGDTGYVLGNPALRPERGLNVDAGAVYSPSWMPDDQAWSVELYGFMTLTEDLIQFVQYRNSSVAQNVDSARIFGVEAGAWFDLFRHLRFRGSLTWMHTENTGDTAAYSGKQLAYRPDLMAYARVEGYHGLEGWFGELGASVEVESISGNFRDPSNLIAVPQRLVLGAGAYLTMWQRQLRLQITARNLTGDQVHDYAGLPLPMFNVMATLRWTPELSAQ